MEYTEAFKELVKNSIENNQYVGLGNPDANILFIGKEAGIDAQVLKNKLNYMSNAAVWNSDPKIYLNPYSPTDKKLRNGNHTWQKYQRLHDQIIGVPSPKDYYIDFITNVFTTELSNLPYTNTASAKKDLSFKENLANRKVNFFTTPFIRRFPVVIITALDSHYIKNNGDKEFREIDNIFEVKFNECVQCSNIKDKFWIHYSKFEEKPKIVIQTRQLTNGASNELSELIGKKIQEFAKKNKIELISSEYKIDKSREN